MAILVDEAVTLLRVDGEWKVTRDEVCAVLSVGSPCPEAS